MTDNYQEVTYSHQISYQGHTDPFCLSPFTSTLRIDIPLNPIYHINIWGQLYTTNKHLPLAYIDLQLFSSTGTQTGQPHTYISQTKTDSNGFYHFDFHSSVSSNYKLLIHSKSGIHNKVIDITCTPNKSLYSYALPYYR